ncbi:hypothetical protein SAMN04487893_104107 [Myroides guanonis]|uniref:Uncharacterized protein n=1 Tax=Myroides guanonis TaxID=1150112 RepID=A0A1I3PGZ0_9FLAO|nr:hypothetical protein SAMN04487893_104107 [Myroides guanonis]
MQIIYSLLCILGGSVYLIYLIKRKNRSTNLWDKSMELKGYLGGLIFIIIGIIMLYRHFF